MVNQEGGERAWKAYGSEGVEGGYRGENDGVFGGAAVERCKSSYRSIMRILAVFVFGGGPKSPPSQSLEGRKGCFLSLPKLTSDVAKEIPIDALPPTSQR